MGRPFGKVMGGDKFSKMKQPFTKTIITVLTILMAMTALWPASRSAGASNDHTPTALGTAVHATAIPTNTPIRTCTPEGCVVTDPPDPFFWQTYLPVVRRISQEDVLPPIVP